MLITTFAAWTAVVVAAVVLLTQLAGWCGSVVVAVAQSLTPLLAAGTIFAALVGRIDGDRPLLVGGLVTTVGVAAVVAPAMIRRRPEVPAPSSEPPTVRVFHGNLLFTNVDDPPALASAIFATMANVLALSELSPAQEAALLGSPFAGHYPYRLGSAAPSGADGMAIWSSLPLVDDCPLPGRPRAGLVATVPFGTDRQLRLVLAHPRPPTKRAGLRHWEPALRDIGRFGQAQHEPTMIVADLNAARWHPPLRRLLDGGWRDAHEALGRGLSASWPTTGCWPVPFVRLDHALLDDGVTVLAVDDVEIPGSDHRGFVVTVTTAGRAGH
ncbi:MAG: hypothetical protein JWM12_1715 [Ilumatobacteraceae bacterium]|nr:hypothetical protein [Ilumatobacteraceae bacterium]